MFLFGRAIGGTRISGWIKGDFQRHAEQLENGEGRLSIANLPRIQAQNPATGSQLGKIVVITS